MVKKKKKPRSKKKKPAKKTSKNPPIVAVVGMACPACGTEHEFDVHEEVSVISCEMACRRATCGALYHAQFRKDVSSLESRRIQIKDRKVSYVLTSLVRIDV